MSSSRVKETRRFQAIQGLLDSTCVQPRAWSEPISFSHTGSKAITGSRVGYAVTDRPPVLRHFRGWYASAVNPAA
jgi:hypothetical protein